MGRFSSTVDFYERARQPYGKAFFAGVAEKLHLDRTQRLLDLGTGPGLLAIGFAPFCHEVVGVDPEPAMLEAARHAAERTGVALNLVQGRAEDLPDDIGTFDIVTIGRALHWMQPDPTRATLARVVAKDGHVLICRPATISDGRNPWLAAYDDARRPWTDSSNEDRYFVDRDAFFEGTEFHRSLSFGVESEHWIPVELLLERVLSLSTSSPARLGDSREEMAAAVREAITPFAVAGLIHEIIETRAEIFARSPAARA